MAQIAIKLSQKLNYKSGEAAALHKEAVGKWMLGQYDNAFEAATVAYSLYDSLDSSSGRARCLQMMALIMDDQERYPEAIRYHRQVIAQYQIAKDSLRLGSAYNNLAGVYYRLNQLDSSQVLYHVSLDIREKVGHQFGIKECCSNLSVVYRRLGNFKKAHAYINRAIPLAISLNDRNGIITTNQNLAGILLAENKLDSAEVIYHKALQLAREMGVQKRILETLNRLRELAEKKEDYQLALKYADQYWTQKDSSHNAALQTKIAALEAQFQSEKKEKEIVQLQQEAKNKTLWRNIFAVGILAALLLAGLLWLSFRYRAQKNAAILQAEMYQKQQLEALDNMKSQFFANISHEFRTPLTLITAPLSQLEEDLTEPRHKKLTQIIRQSSHRLLNLINQILHLSKLEAKEVKLKTKLQDIIPFLRGWTMSFNSLAAEQNIDLIFNTDQESHRLYFEADKIEQAITNLLSNAFKFSSAGDAITMDVSSTKLQEKTYLCIRIVDTGMGIPEEDLPHIFNRFYQVQQQEQLRGTGIGLSLAKELVELHHGLMKVESTLGKGTSFFVYLPFGKEQLADDQISSIAASPYIDNPLPAFPTQAVLEPTKEEITTQDLNILVVEDNVDVSNYLLHILSTKYKVIKAADGQEGLQMAIDHTPDLIISDVMMPKMNGYELCHAIKQDVRTSHIPLMLLTAKAEKEDKLMGFENLADAYLEKPFQIKELLTRIQGMLANRKLVQSHFKKRSLLEPKSIKVNSVDQVFLQSIADLIEVHIDDEMFGVEKMANKLLLSRSQLHRKLKAIANLTPSQYIRNYRLHRAKDLLESKAGTVSEIAFQVGFSNPSYFAKVFQDLFGQLPSDVLKN